MVGDSKERKSREPFDSADSNSEARSEGYLRYGKTRIDTKRAKYLRNLRDEYRYSMQVLPHVLYDYPARERNKSIQVGSLRDSQTGCAGSTVRNSATTAGRSEKLEIGKLA